MAEYGPPVLLPPPPPGVRPLAAWPPPRPQNDPLGLLGQLLWAPFVATSALLAVSLWLTTFGVPLLFVVLPPFFACNERRRGRRPPRSMVAAGLVAIPLVVGGAVVAVTFADGDPAASVGLGAIVVWSIGATVVLLRLRAAPPRWRGQPETLGLWLQVLWAPMAVGLLWPAGFLVGLPFLLLALAPCYAGRLRHQRRLIPARVMVGSSIAVGAWSIAAVVVVVNQDGLLLSVLTALGLLAWVGPAIATNVLLWRQPAFRSFD